jgi:hypothetical protein
LGTGDELNVVDRDDGLYLILAGQPGRVQAIYVTPRNLPGSMPRFALTAVDPFLGLLQSRFVIPSSGWLRVDLASSSLPVPGPAGLRLHSQAFEFGAPVSASNLQSTLLTR